MATFKGVVGLFLCDMFSTLLTVQLDSKKFNKE